ncbi:hypothetical protein PLCT2_00068 [Planctomycetaceae bacterium]|nr:hypothetical protein PLCT2_00068 [Planctomycetaceae bacterium]
MVRAWLIFPVLAIVITVFGCAPSEPGNAAWASNTNAVANNVRARCHQGAVDNNLEKLAGAIRYYQRAGWKEYYVVWEHFRFNKPGLPFLAVVTDTAHSIAPIVAFNDVIVVNRLQLAEAILNALPEEARPEGILVIKKLGDSGSGEVNITFSTAGIKLVAGKVSISHSSVDYEAKLTSGADGSRLEHVGTSGS